MEMGAKKGGESMLLMSISRLNWWNMSRPASLKLCSLLKESILCRELLLVCDPLPARLDDPLVFIRVSIPEEVVVLVSIDHPLLWIVHPITAVKPPQGDLGRRHSVSQLGAS